MGGCCCSGRLERQSATAALNLLLRLLLLLLLLTWLLSDLQVQVLQLPVTSLTLTAVGFKLVHTVRWQVSLSMV